MTLEPSIWTKSSYSSNEEPNCVEVAATPGLVRVRDSKNVPGGPQLAFPETQWADFIASELARP
ncbi:DUF397 domain-containing protein [Streptomyces sp. PR69]|uniref:DUF397 domain-containing protein n=1 Tax=Streptomyces sp. PR69 TaxID=2984950 RepID=UPI0022645182|nr:DUF397 domain-containing protein [Streptomyces sp. PR69]